MRMWKVAPELLCRKHLLGEHVEMHMFIGTLRKGISVRGYVDTGLVELQNIVKRHDELAAEMVSRGYNHFSPLFYRKKISGGIVDVEKNFQDLYSRCAECRKRMKKLKTKLNK